MAEYRNKSLAETLLEWTVYIICLILAYVQRWQHVVYTQGEIKVRIVAFK